MKEKEFLSNIDIKSLITVVGLLLWVAVTIYGFITGKFDDVFAFFKECFLMIVSFYLGSKVNKEDKEENEPLSAVIYEGDDY